MSGGMILEHYSRGPLGDLRDRNPAGPATGHRKPRGLWLSVPGEDDWPSWCRGEDFHLEGLAHVSRFSLVQGHNVLLVTSLVELDAFHDRFTRPCTITRAAEIDWEAVGACYDGVIISPYQWARRLHGPASDWYYGWDCASGCIWRPTRALQPLETAVQP